MKTVIKIDLDDEALTMLANKIDGKVTKRKATRNEVIEVTTRAVQGLVHHELAARSGANSLSQFERYSVADPEDAAILAGKSKGFIYGWNKVKHSL